MEDPAFHDATGDISDSRFARFEIAGWEDRAGAYDDFFAPITSRVIDDLITAADVGPGSHVLDVGTGPGYVAAAFAARGVKATGIDVAQQMVDLARTHYPNVEFRRADVHKLPFTNEAFDAVVGTSRFPICPALKTPRRNWLERCAPAVRSCCRPGTDPRPAGSSDYSLMQSLRWARRRQRISPTARTSSASPRTARSRRS